ncbi:MAG: DUF2948 family protein [Halocynthiibacter sp.]
MTQDATFEDASDAPLYLLAQDADDLQVLSSLTQDAVFPATEIKWQSATNRLSLLINRVRWEDKAAAERSGRPLERVQSVLVFDMVRRVASQGISRKDSDTVLSILSISFSSTDAPSGQITVTLAGDGAIRMDVEALEVLLRDVTRPYVAVSKRTPKHPD